MLLLLLAPADSLLVFDALACCFVPAPAWLPVPAAPEPLLLPARVPDVVLVGALLEAAAALSLSARLPPPPPATAIELSPGLFALNDSLPAGLLLSGGFLSDWLLSDWLLSDWLLSDWFLSDWFLSDWLLSDWLLSDWLLSDWPLSDWPLSDWLRLAEALLVLPEPVSRRGSAPGLLDSLPVVPGLALRLSVAVLSRAPELELASRGWSESAAEWARLPASLELVWAALEGEVSDVFDRLDRLWSSD